MRGPLLQRLGIDALRTENVKYRLLPRLPNVALVEDWDDLRIQDFVENYALGPGSIFYEPDEPHEKFSDKTSKSEVRGQRDSCLPDRSVSQYEPASRADSQSMYYKHETPVKRVFSGRCATTRILLALVWCATILSLVCWQLRSGCTRDRSS
jgi:hypothetical protein